MTVYFIRHGQTDWNAAGRLQGQRDVPLNATGLGQAESVAERLKAVAGDSLSEARFVASPLQRTRQTMEVLRARLDLAPQDYAVDAPVKEINFGTWEARPGPRSVGVTAAAPWRGTATVGATARPASMAKAMPCWWNG